MGMVWGFSMDILLAFQDAGAFFTSPLVGEVESFQAVAIAPSSLDEEGWGGVTRSVAGEG